MNKVKTIRSFVKRQRRLPPNKQKIFDEAWEIYGKKIFNRDAMLVLEIGFGMGTTLFNSAKNNPEQNFIGIEVHQPGIAALFAQLKIQALNNLRIYNEDAVMVLQQYISDNSLDKVLIFFPDPWPKKRHHKRRLIQPSFVELLQKKIKPKGVLHIATDWEDYANHIISVLKNNPAFTVLDPEKSLPFLSDRILTKFEQRGKEQGHKIFDLLFERKYTC
jgi:tRNA (guanine-N7-)-methyltransferase